MIRTAAAVYARFSSAQGRRSLARAAMALALALAVILAMIRVLRVPLLNQLVQAFVSFFRGSPLLVQLFLFYYGLPQIVPAALVESCWPQIARASAVYGSGRLARRSFSGWIGPVAFITAPSFGSSFISSRS